MFRPVPNEVNSLIIKRVDAFAVASEQAYEPTKSVPQSATLPGSHYLRIGDYPQLYSQHAEAVLVRVETDAGLVGWGEAQAPVGSRVVLAVIEEILAPTILGRDAEATGLRFQEMYETLRVRGQTGGYQLDAIAGLDTALWDLRGKAVGRSLPQLLGGARRDRLPCYVTGLREQTPAGRQDEARQWAEQGIGVKPCLGLGYHSDAAEVARLREAVGPEAELYVDAFWKYSYAEALKVGRVYEELGVGFLEAPLAPEDLEGHARLADKLDLPIAVGEPMRTTHAFLPWLQRRALGIAQPDQMRNGVTETVNIARLAEAFSLPVALHTGCVTVVGMAATWQIAATLPNFLVQEFQPVMLATFNPWLDQPLTVEDGELVVPTGDGLGLQLDEERIAAVSRASVSAAL